MKGFSDRETGFEAKFARDQEFAFRLTARRNRLFGLWAAGRLGMPAGDACEAYAKTVVAADLASPGDADLMAKVRGDLAAKGVSISDMELRAELARAEAEARRQLAET